MTRNDALNEQMRDARYERILSSALRLFATRGLAATKVSDIAVAAEMSQGLLYHYFATKEQIYIELVARAFERMNHASRRLEELPLPPRAKIAMAVTELLRQLEVNDEFANYFQLTAQIGVVDTLPQEALAIHRKQRAVPYDVIARILRAGQRDGSIRAHDADEMAVVFWTMIKGLALHRVTYGKKFKAPDPRILMGAFFAENEP